MEHFQKAFPHSYGGVPVGVPPSFHQWIKNVHSLHIWRQWLFKLQNVQNIVLIYSKEQSAFRLKNTHK